MTQRTDKWVTFIRNISQNLCGVVFNDYTITFNLQTVTLTLADFIIPATLPYIRQTKWINTFIWSLTSNTFKSISLNVFFIDQKWNMGVFLFLFLGLRIASFYPQILVASKLFFPLRPYWYHWTKPSFIHTLPLTFQSENRMAMKYTDQFNNVAKFVDWSKWKKSVIFVSCLVSVRFSHVLSETCQQVFFFNAA